MKEKTVCFTGHRKIDNAARRKTGERLQQTLRALIAEGYTYFGAGGALGFDTLAAQTVLDLKREFPHICLILVLPCLAQTRGWSAEDVACYEAIKAAADKVVYTSEAYTKGCMHKRNRHLVDHSSVCVCYCRETSGGTYYTVNYAKQAGLRICNLAE